MPAEIPTRAPEIPPRPPIPHAHASSQLLIPLFGVDTSIRICLRLFSLGYVLLAAATTPATLVGSVLLVAVGCAALPFMLVKLVGAVGADQQGALLGATEALKTLGAALSAASAPSVFGYFISDAAPIKMPGAPYLLGAALAAGSYVLQPRDG